MLDACSFAASLAGCEVEAEVTRGFHGYRFAKADEPVRLAEAALRRTGHEPTYALSGGGADANVFNLRGLACLNLANGMAEIHTPQEHIAVADLEEMVEVTLALLDGGAWRLASAAARSPRCWSATTAWRGSRWTGRPALRTHG